MNFYQTCPTSATSADSRAVHPVDFDPQKYPILSQHWFGIEPRAQPANGVRLRSTKEAA